MNKPHITIFKDNSHRIYNPHGAPTPPLDGARVFHVSDLITEASSYARGWIPEIEAAGARMKWSLSVVDRLQGGGALLASHGVRQISLICVSKDLFDRALETERITKDQYDMIIAYIADPVGSMADFLKNNPEFLQNALNADERTRARAKMLMESGVYGI